MWRSVIVPGDSTPWLGDRGDPVEWRRSGPAAAGPVGQQGERVGVIGQEDDLAGFGEAGDHCEQGLRPVEPGRTEGGVDQQRHLDQGTSVDSAAYELAESAENVSGTLGLLNDLRYPFADSTTIGHRPSHRFAQFDTPSQFQRPGFSHVLLRSVRQQQARQPRRQC